MKRALAATIAAAALSGLGACSSAPDATQASTSTIPDGGSVLVLGDNPPKPVTDPAKFLKDAEAVAREVRPPNDTDQFKGCFFSPLSDGSYGPVAYCGPYQGYPENPVPRMLELPGRFHATGPNQWTFYKAGARDMQWDGPTAYLGADLQPVPLLSPSPSK